MKKKARVIAFYLPQFHPIPENDQWWGKGFTEWTNVTKAQPLFEGHVQPKLPADLGFYDLRIPEVREAQAKMAQEYGVEGFCYWHYWLGDGKRLLEKPFNEVLESGKPDFPFCLGWANHDWKGKGFMGEEDRSLADQTYPSKEDAFEHFQFLLKAFKDHRYIQFEGKPILVIYRPQEIPDAKEYLDYWRSLAVENGLEGIYILGDTPSKNWKELGIDGTLYSGQRHLNDKVWEKLGWKDKLKGTKQLKKVKYKDVLKYLLKPGGYSEGEYPVIIPNWDTTPRIKEEAIIFYENNPDVFQEHVRQIFDSVKDRPEEQNIVFLRAWNEWAEGNYLEPDMEFGMAMLEKLREEVFYK